MLADSVGGIAEFARRMEMSDSQASQLIGQNPKRRIGDKIAERVERAFNMEPGELDWPPENSTYKQDVTGVTRGVQSLIGEIQAAADKGVFTDDLLQVFRTILRLAYSEKRAIAESYSEERISGRGAVESAQHAAEELESTLDSGEIREPQQHQERTPRRKSG